MTQKIVIATTNKNKVERITNLLADLNVKILSLDDIKAKKDDPEESLLSCVSISAQKALHYAATLPKNTLILTQDDTIVMENIDDIDNPGLHIKEPVIKKYGNFTDEKAASYYTELAKKYGGMIPMTFHYGHALAVADSDERGTIHLVAAESKLNARLVDKVYKLETVPGYFLSAIMQVKVNNRWIYSSDLTIEQSIIADDDLKKSIVSLFDKLGIEY